MIDFFKYEDGKGFIQNIGGYNGVSEFDLTDTNDLQKFIKTINRLYDECDDERLRFDEDANQEYYLREAVVDIILDYYNRVKYNGFHVTGEVYKIQLDLMNQIKNEVDRLLD